MDYAELKRCMMLAEELEASVRYKERKVDNLRQKLTSVSAVDLGKEMVDGGSYTDRKTNIVAKIIEWEALIKQDKIELNNLNIYIEECKKIKSKWNEEELYMFNLKMKGYTYEEIAEETCYSRRTIHRKLKKMGLVNKD